MDPNRVTTPFDSLILPIVKIEQKHRKAVAAIIQESLAVSYGLQSSPNGKQQMLCCQPGMTDSDVDVSSPNRSARGSHIVV